MEKILRTHAGRLSFLLGGVDLVLLGVANLAEDPAIATALTSWVPMLSVAASIYIVVLATVEIGGLLPIALFSIMAVLGGIYVFGLSYASGANPASGVVLVSVGIIFALVGLRPELRSIQRPMETST